MCLQRPICALLFVVTPYLWFGTHEEAGKVVRLENELRSLTQALHCLRDNIQSSPHFGNKPKLSVMVGILMSPKSLRCSQVGLLERDWIMGLITDLL